MQQIMRLGRGVGTWGLLGGVLAPVDGFGVLAAGGSGWFGSAGAVGLGLMPGCTGLLGLVVGVNAGLLLLRLAVGLS